jgi:hypothetical protein
VGIPDEPGAGNRTGLLRQAQHRYFDMHILSEEGPSIGLWEALDNWQCYCDSGMSPSEKTSDEMR